MAVPTTPTPPSSAPQHPPLKRKRSLSPEPPSPRLSPPLLLLALPALLALPPTHPHHVSSLRLSLLAVRRCLRLRDHLAPSIECRAWTAFVELGMKIVGAGLSGNRPEGVDWARGLENEIGVAIGKGLVLSQAHPILRPYIHHLTLLHARFSYWQHNQKFARALLRRHVAALTSTDPPAHHYATHLALVEHALSANRVDLPAVLHALAAIDNLAERWGHPDVSLIGNVIKLRALVSALDWAEVLPLLEMLESALHLDFPSTDSQTEQSKNTLPASALHISLELHVLTLGVLAHVQAGRSCEAGARIRKLHLALDLGALDREGIRDGIIEVPLGGSVPLLVHTTHPRVFFHLAFLVSTVAMRDATGRRPKPKVFASEGLAVCERERSKDPLKGVGRYPRWSGLRERQGVEERLAKIEADLLCELVGVCIQRSEFEEAEEHLAHLIAHARTHALWDSYSARVALHHAHLAHALCDSVRALKCYRVAAHLASDGAKARAGIAVARFVRVAAQAGEVGLRLGIARREMDRSETLDECFCEWGARVAAECRALGGTLEPVGRVLQACLGDQIVIAKIHLKAALHSTTKALDNNLRALVLALTSSHYLHTSSEYAEAMLSSARQLAAGLGAPASKAEDLRQPRKVGNAALGLWVGQQLLELYRRTGRDARATRQEAINEELVRAVEQMQQRARLDEGDADGDADGDIRMSEHSL